MRAHAATHSEACKHETSHPPIYQPDNSARLLNTQTNQAHTHAHHHHMHARTRTRAHTQARKHARARKGTHVECSLCMLAMHDARMQARTYTHAHARRHTCSQMSRLSIHRLSIHRLSALRLSQPSASPQHTQHDTASAAAAPPKKRSRSNLGLGSVDSRIRVPSIPDSVKEGSPAFLKEMCLWLPPTFLFAPGFLGLSKPAKLLSSVPLRSVAPWSNFLLHGATYTYSTPPSTSYATQLM